jgi:two-component system NtrC family sensor kinase
MKTLYSIPPLITLICFVSLTVMTWIRRKKNRVNRLFSLICLLGSLLYIDILVIFNIQSSDTALWVSRIDHVFIIYLIPLYIHFFHAYLGISGKDRIVRVAYGVAFILMLAAPTPYLIESMQSFRFGFWGKGGVLYPLVGLGSGAAVCYVMVLLYRAIRNETGYLQKNKLKYIALGFGILGLMIGLNTLPLLGYPVYPMGNFGFIPMIIFSVGLFRYNLLDMDFLIRKSLLYSILTACLTIFYALIITIINRFFQGYDFSNSVLFPVLFFFGITFVFGPLQSFTQSGIDRIFLKNRNDYQKTIKMLSQTVASVLKTDEIARLIVETIVHAMQVSQCSLFLADQNGFLMTTVQGQDESGFEYNRVSDDSPLVQWLLAHRQPADRNRLILKSSRESADRILSECDQLKAAIVLPMIFRNRLNGFVAIGEKASGDMFSDEDIDLLEILASQSALAIENAASYRRIDELNKTLEQKVKDRTQDLQSALLEKQKAQELLIRSESLAAIGMLVAGTAHELNNPIAGAASLIQSTIEDMTAPDWHQDPDDDIIADLQFALNELGKAKSIVASLLGMSRQTETVSESVDLNRVIQDALRVLHNQVKTSRIRFIETYAEDLPIIRGNFASLGQVVLNIIQNAIQSVDRNSGVIEVVSRVDNEGKQIIFECADNGPGVPEHLRQDVFKPFFTTKEVGKGTGLGLYICHEIVSRHGGELILDKSDDSGAKFILKLPVLP